MAKTKAEDTSIDTGERKPLEDLQALKNELQNPEPEPKKKRKPYKKREKIVEPESDQAQNPFDTAMMAQGVKLAFNLIAKSAGPHWQLSEHEADQGAAVFDALAQKYFPLLGPYAIEINCLLWSVMVIGPRFMHSVELKKMAEKETISE